MCIRDRFWPGQQEKTFTKTVIYKDPKGINADITVVMTRTVYMPALNVGGHMGTCLLYTSRCV